jgi:hypothetical protein
VDILVSDCFNVTQEFFRWEFATAVAGSILGINPFDQPDVEAAKVEARRITSEYEKTGSLPKEEPFFREGKISLYADPCNAQELQKTVGKDQTLKNYLRAHLDRLSPGDYFCILAYLPMDFEMDLPIEEIRTAVRNSRKIATCVGFGPRYLHSTGQAYKGGPDSGVFVEITANVDRDLPIPGHRLSFEVVNAAQARGDLEVLARRGRRLLRIHLEENSPEVLKLLKEAFPYDETHTYC